MSKPSATMRIQPSIKTGVLVWLGYIVILTVIQLCTGILYTEMGKSAHNLFFGAGIFLIIGATYLAVVVTLLGWWHPVLFEQRRSKRRWPIIFPGITVLLCLLNLLATDWTRVDIWFVGSCIVLLLVGFTEEISTRGALLAGLRSKLSEAQVWFYTSLVFGLMHGLNFFFGQDLQTTIVQMISAFLIGTVFYTLRRTTGSLLYPIALHGAWDVSAYLLLYSGTVSGIGSLIGAIELLTGIAALICVRFVIKDANELLIPNSPHTKGRPGGAAKT